MILSHLMIAPSFGWLKLTQPTNQNDHQKRNNGSPSKNPDIKTPLVMSFPLRVVIHFSSLAAF